MLTSSHGVDDFTYNSSVKKSGYNASISSSLLCDVFNSWSFLTCNDSYTIRHATESLNRIKRIQNRSCITSCGNGATGELNMFIQQLLVVQILNVSWILLIFFSGVPLLGLYRNTMQQLSKDICYFFVHDIMSLPCNLGLFMIINLLFCLLCCSCFSIPSPSV